MLFWKNSIDKNLKKSIADEIDSLGPWYQPIDFGYGIKTNAVNKKGRIIRFNTLDRGTEKWEKFILPSLPFSLNGKTILDCGCNAGLFLINACKNGAVYAHGIEYDSRYYQQAMFTVRTFEKLEKKKYPISIYRSSFEDFDYTQIGSIDLAMFLNTIYHIGKTTRKNEDSDKILQHQTRMLKRVSEVAQYILFQGNPLEDQGRGKGKESLYNIIEFAGLRVKKETVYRHPRGLLLLVEA